MGVTICDTTKNKAGARWPPKPLFFLRWWTWLNPTFLKTKATAPTKPFGECWIVMKFTRPDFLGFVEVDNFWSDFVAGPSRIDRFPSIWVAFRKGNGTPAISGKSRLVNYYILPGYFTVKSPFCTTTIWEFFCLVHFFQNHLSWSLHDGWLLYWGGYTTHLFGEFWRL